MTAQYVPTTGIVRVRYAHAFETPDRAARYAQFDRWLAQHDREVAAAALRDMVADLEYADPQSYPPERLRRRIESLERGDNE